MGLDKHNYKPSTSAECGPMSKHVFNLFEDDMSLLTEIQKSAQRSKPYTERIVAAENAVVDLARHNWADILFSERIMAKIRHKISSGEIIYNRKTGHVANANVVPIPIKQWVLQMNYAKGTDTKQPVLYHYDAPDYVVVMLINECDDPGGLLLARDLDTDEETSVKLTNPGDTIILHGRQVEHCVTKLEKEDSERITLIMSLVDIENSPENVELNLIKDKLTKRVISDWLQWHVNFNTKSPDMLIGELLSKL